MSNPFPSLSLMSASEQTGCACLGKLVYQITSCRYGRRPTISVLNRICRSKGAPITVLEMRLYISFYQLIKEILCLS